MRTFRIYCGLDTNGHLPLNTNHQRAPMNTSASTASTWAVFQRHMDMPTKVLYSHLTEETADEVVDRMNTNLQQRGIPACVWSEQHHPQAIYVINN